MCIDNRIRVSCKWASGYHCGGINCTNLPCANLGRCSALLVPVPLLVPVQTAVKQEMKKIKAAAEITQVSVDRIGGEEQGANARASPEGDGTGPAARKSEKVCAVCSHHPITSLPCAVLCSSNPGDC